MTQIGEGIFAEIIKYLSDEYLFTGVLEVTFDSGIQVFDLQAAGVEVEVPAAGTPHWTPGANFPAVYVRAGGTGETKALKVKVGWDQVGYDGSAKLKGESADGRIVIEGDFSISGATGDVVVDCQFTTKPTTVANYGAGAAFTWTVTAKGETFSAPGGNLLRLFFVDAKPKPHSWGYYKKHYLKVIDWATAWAAGAAGEPAVLAAIWSRFSDGTRARVPHATGFAYWKTDNPVQDLKKVIAPDTDAGTRGWSCRAIAHLFMECLAVHGIRCAEVIPETPGGTRAFLVHNWNVAASPVPNWEVAPDLYYAGSWVPSSSPPLNTPTSTSLTKQPIAGPSTDPLEIDMRKQPGVPAQGQRNAPLMFGNHWIVQVGGHLYDTSYGIRHPNDIVAYATASLGGWLIDVLSDTYTTGFLWWLTTHNSKAFRSRHISNHTLVRGAGASN
jgi:hypothetical protein